MTYYAQRIAKLLGVDARTATLVLGWMWTEHSTLDGLDAAKFKREAKECLGFVGRVTDAENVRLAESYGLTVPEVGTCRICGEVNAGNTCCPPEPETELERAERRADEDGDRRLEYSRDAELRGGGR